MPGYGLLRQLRQLRRCHVHLSQVGWQSLDSSACSRRSSKSLGWQSFLHWRGSGSYTAFEVRRGWAPAPTSHSRSHQRHVCFFSCSWAFGICIASAVHAYYNLQVRTGSDINLCSSAAGGAFWACLGDFDLFEFEGLDPIYRQTANNLQELEPIDPDPGSDYVWVHMLFYIVRLGITVLLMNVLIGVLSANYELYEDQSAVLLSQSTSENSCGTAN